MTGTREQEAWGQCCTAGAWPTASEGLPMCLFPIPDSDSASPPSGHLVESSTDVRPETSQTSKGKRVGGGGVLREEALTPHEWRYAFKFCPSGAGNWTWGLRNNRQVTASLSHALAQILLANSQWNSLDSGRTLNTEFTLQPLQSCLILSGFTLLMT